MQAKKKKIDALDAGKLGLTLAPRVRVTAIEAPTERKAGIKVASVDELVDQAQERGQVL